MFPLKYVRINRQGVQGRLTLSLQYQTEKETCESPRITTFARGHFQSLLFTGRISGKLFLLRIRSGYIRYWICFSSFSENVFKLGDTQV